MSVFLNSLSNSYYVSLRGICCGESRQFGWSSVSSSLSRSVSSDLLSIFSQVGQVYAIMLTVLPEIADGV